MYCAHGGVEATAGSYDGNVLAERFLVMCYCNRIYVWLCRRLGARISLGFLLRSVQS